VNLAADLSTAWPEIFVAITAMLLLMYGVFQGNQSARLISWLAVGVMFVTAILVLSSPAGRAIAFNGMFVIDEFAAFTKVLLLLGAALTLILAMPFNAREGIPQFEFPVLVLFAVLGMMMMVSANDLMSLYLGIELQSLSSSPCSA
jgi:NADH-quinone oxidoreductase subunit N